MTHEDQGSKFPVDERPDVASARAALEKGKQDNAASYAALRHKLLNEPDAAVVERWKAKTREQIASAIVEALIYCKGNLNKYQETLEMALVNFEAAIEARKHD